MIEFENTAIIVTAKLAGVNLRGLPLLDVAGQPLLACAAANVEKAGLGVVLVATPDNQVAEVMRKLGKDVLVAPGKEQSHCAMADWDCSLAGATRTSLPSLRITSAT